MRRLVPVLESFIWSSMCRGCGCKRRRRGSAFLSDVIAGIHDVQEAYRLLLPVIYRRTAHTSQGMAHSCQHVRLTQARWNKRLVCSVLVALQARRRL